METSNEQNKPTFLTVVEIPAHKASIYVTSEHIVVQDFEDKTNGLVIPWKQFKENANKPSTAENVDSANNAEPGE